MKVTEAHIQATREYIVKLLAKNYYTNETATALWVRCTEKAQKSPRVLFLSHFTQAFYKAVSFEEMKAYTDNHLETATAHILKGLPEFAGIPL